MFDVNCWDHNNIYGSSVIILISVNHGASWIILVREIALSNVVFMAFLPRSAAKPSANQGPSTAWHHLSDLSGLQTVTHVPSPLVVAIMDHRAWIMDQGEAMDLKATQRKRSEP